jgi:YcxB-like protein
VTGVFAAVIVCPKGAETAPFGHTIIPGSRDYRAGLVSMDVPWDRVRHVDSRKDYWILAVDRVHRIVLYKEAFTREQQAELSLFLAARPGITGSTRRLR